MRKNYTFILSLISISVNASVNEFEVTNMAQQQTRKLMQVEQRRGEGGLSDSQMFRKSQSALYAYPEIKLWVQDFGDDLQDDLLGEHADKVIWIAPFITQKIEFSVSKVKWFVNFRDEEIEFRYNYRF